MAHVAPLRAYTPPRERAAKVASVPYDVVDRAEAQSLARGNSDSFLHVTKPEIDLPPEASADAIYAQGKRALQRLRQEGALVLHQTPAYFVYALTMGTHRQVGFVVCASVHDYNAGVVKKHEFTRPDKEDDRVNHMQALQAQSGKVFLLYRDCEVLEALLAGITKKAADLDFTSPDGVEHSLWRVDDAATVAQITQGFADVGSLYIADGHHRAAAASRVAKESGDGDGPLLAVAFAQKDAQILAYNRVIHDLQGRTPEAFLSALKAAHFTVSLGKPQGDAPCRCGMYLAAAWYTLGWQAPPKDDPVAALDVSVVQERILAPLLGIEDPRRNKRIEFVGGIRGDAELERLVDGGHAVAFSMRATAVDELLAVADAGRVMPPKSTWFEPKLRDGLVVLPLYSPSTQTSSS